MTLTPTPTVTLTPVPGGSCGDGVLNTGEDCDTGGVTCTAGSNTAATFTCSGTCQCACPKFVDFVGTTTIGKLDTGWTGQGHDATVVDRGKVTVAVTSCPGSDAGTRPCGVCNLLGPVDNLGAAVYPAGPGPDINNHRCTNNTNVICSNDTPCVQQCLGGTNDGVACTVDSECPSGACVAAGTCEYYFGSYLPLAAGGVSTCVGNQITGTITGTANIETGSSATAATLLSTVYSGPVLAQPCPQCNGDGTPNDGIRGGSCVGGDRNTKACDVNGTSPNTVWGKTSLDCPPLAGGKLASLAVDLSNTTGTKTRTLTTDNPLCTAPGFTTLRCQCDTCDNAEATPCSANADCVAVGATICGGKRCVAGDNNGAPCADTSECPNGGACTTTGTKTAPNQCDGGSGDCKPGDNTPPTSATDHICGTGPFERFCGPAETFRSCTNNAGCGFPGDTCSVSRFRECFDNGVLGDVVTAQGVVSTPVADASDPTLAALFCIGPTGGGAVDGAAGLPGLGKLELPGHARGLDP